MDTNRCASCMAIFNLPGCKKLSTVTIPRKLSKNQFIVYKVPELLNYVFNLPVPKRFHSDSDIGVCGVCGHVLRRLYTYYNKMQQLLISGSVLEKILKEFDITEPVAVTESKAVEFDDEDSNSGHPETSPSKETEAFLDPLRPNSSSSGHKHLPPMSASTNYTFPKVTLITAESSDVKTEDEYNSTDHSEQFDLKSDHSPMLEPEVQSAPPVKPKENCTLVRRRIAKSRKARYAREISAAQTASSSSVTLTGRTPVPTILASKFLALARKVLPTPVPPTLEVEAKSVSNNNSSLFILPDISEGSSITPTTANSAPLKRTGRKQMLVSKPVYEEPYPEPILVGPSKKMKISTLSNFLPATSQILVIDGFIPIPSGTPVSTEIDYDSEPEVESQILNASETEAEQKFSLEAPMQSSKKTVRKNTLSAEYLKKQKLKAQKKLTELPPYVHGPCSFCGKTFINKNKNWMKEHIRFTHQHISNITCKICGKPCGSNHHRLEHQKSHLSAAERMGLRGLEPSQYLCQECGKTYSSEGGLKNHSKLHGVESRELSCTEPNCDYTCTTKPSLLKHVQQIHDLSTEPKHHCKVCQRGFRLYTDLKKHEMTSCDVVNRPFACEEGDCLHRFKFKQNVVLHLMDIHGLDPEEARDKVYPGLPCPDWVTKYRRTTKNRRST